MYENYTTLKTLQFWSKFAFLMQSKLWKLFYFTRVIVALAFLGHQTSHSQNKCFSCAAHDFF